MGAIFVTATGTDVGKTYVTCAIIRALRGQGRAVAALKPVISGFDTRGVVTSDTGRILSALGRTCDSASIEAVSPWRYTAALSVDMAAAREGRAVPFDEVSAFCRAQAAASDVCLIEGAGGLMSPIDARRTNLDLIVALEAPLLLVAGSYLGTISHTLTALAAIDRAKARPLAVVISESESSPVPLAELTMGLAAFTTAPVFAVARNADAPPALVELLARYFSNGRVVS